MAVSVIRRFSQMQMSRVKTDKNDAKKMIAEYSRTEQHVLWQKPEQHVITLQQMEALLAKLQTEYTTLSNQLGSFESSGMLIKALRKDIGAELLHKGRLIKKLTQQMEQIAQAHYSEMLADLESIPGLGWKTAIMLTVLSGGFTRFYDYRKLSSYIGISPRIFESGTSVKGKFRICKMDMSLIRCYLVCMFLECIQM